MTGKWLCGNRAICVGDWKLVAAKGGPWELYGLRNDRAESNDLAKVHPEKMKELESLWNRQLEEFSGLAAKTAPGQSPKSPADCEAPLTVELQNKTFALVSLAVEMEVYGFDGAVASDETERTGQWWNRPPP
ncbi:MAG: hypothetical protein KY475_12795 [Planctomycetes bacterium]|nr:hypothetical protein [Planctomycetota bacterium]